MTAEEKLIEHRILTNTIEESGNFPLNLSRDTHIGTAKSIQRAMIEFAKMHVTEALKSAAEKATANLEPDYLGGEWTMVDKDSILTAYPLTNIK